MKVKGTRAGRQTREAILLAASRAIQLRGYQGTSLDALLRESGIGKGNFYYHFRSKEDLGYAILDQIMDAFLHETLDPCFADRGGEPLAQIRCFLDRVLELKRAQNGAGGCPLGSLASELADVHEGFRARLAAVFSAWGARLTRALEEARGRGTVGPECQPASVAQFLVASLEGAMLMAKLAKDVHVLEQCVLELKRYLRGFERATAVA